MLGQHLKISYPIFLVLGGLIIGFIPGIPTISLNPELVFLIFLPPLLYEAAWYTSWHDFWKWRRPIGLLAFGLVIFTSVIIAYVSQALIPGFTLALGFLLGGIISPPDAVAATSVLKNLKVPKRVLTILEGESLVNDASSLIVFRFAIAAVAGTFSLQHAVASFFLVTAMGILIGLFIAHIFYAIHRWLPTTPSINTAFTFMTPYFMYIAAEHFHYSGVMAVVSGGLFLSYRSHEIFDHQTRIQAISVWSTIIFILNGLVFILIGLELPTIVKGLGDYSLSAAICYGLIISLLTVLIRILWVYPGTYLPRWLSRKIRTTEARPSWQNVFIVSWSGMRGVVSLASALSIPLTLSNGETFPQRNLILFITFVVILVTLVFQGLTLPFFMKYLNVRDVEASVPEEEQEAGVRLRLMKAALLHLNEHYKIEIAENELIENIKRQLENGITLTSQQLDSLVCDTVKREEVERYQKISVDLIKAQRKELAVLHKENSFEDKILRRQEHLLDLEETKMSKS